MLLLLLLASSGLEEGGHGGPELRGVVSLFVLVFQGILSLAPSSFPGRDGQGCLGLEMLLLVRDDP